MVERQPLPRICVALGFSTTEKLIQAARAEVEAGENFLEFRVDYLNNPRGGAELISRFLRGHPDCTVLATCRRHQNHGKFNGSVNEQLQVLAAAVEAGARAVDVEIETAESAVEKLSALRERSRLILSYHNFTGTPALETVLRRMVKIPADAYKLVTTARKPSDVLRVLTLVKAHPKLPLVLLAMGEQGFATRVLSPCFGGLFTYAAPSAAEGTAAGQVSAKMLRSVYRIDRVTRAARIYGVIADPVRHSISPAVQNRAFQSRRLDAVYLPFRVPGPLLKDFFTFAGGLPLAGFSVTIPHKQKVLRYLDYIDPLSRRIGAVNTVWRKAGKWRGANTDVEGILGPLARHLRLSKASILVAGNGGAARSAAFALADAGAKVAIVGRNPDRVRALGKACGAEPLGKEEAQGRHFDALIHATPLGMFPHVNECFFDGALPADLVFDMVYNPMETKLVLLARQQGKEVILGTQMFLAQAERQFEIWTGESAPRAAMQRAVTDALVHGTAEAAMEVSP